MTRVLVILLVMALVSCTSLAQLNFSTGWGKRSNTDSNCKASMDNLMLIYKMIQNEAKKLVECENFNN